MNSYELFLTKLKAMQVQGYPQSQILEKYKEWLPNVLLYLDKHLMIDLIAGNTTKVLELRNKIKYVSTLEEVIKIGLLEQFLYAEPKV